MSCKHKALKFEAAKRQFCGSASYTKADSEKEGAPRNDHTMNRLRYCPAAINFACSLWSPTASEALSYGLNFKIFLGEHTPRHTSHLRPEVKKKRRIAFPGPNPNPSPSPNPKLQPHSQWAVQSGDHRAVFIYIYIHLWRNLQFVYTYTSMNKRIIRACNNCPKLDVCPPLLKTLRIRPCRSIDVIAGTPSLFWHLFAPVYRTLARLYY